MQQVYLCLATDCNFVNWVRAFSSHTELDAWIREWAGVYEVPHVGVSTDGLIELMRECDLIIDYELADIDTGELTTDGMKPFSRLAQH